LCRPAEKKDNQSHKLYGGERGLSRALMGLKGSAKTVKVKKTGFVVVLLISSSRYLLLPLFFSLCAHLEVCF